MKKKLARSEAMKKISDFFSKKDFSAGEARKIKRLAMQYNIKLGFYRKRFCKNCFFNLRKGKVRVTKFYKTVICENCGERNKWKIG